MQEKLEGLLWGSFVADALSLGLHWEYDMDLLQEKFQKISGYVDPRKNSYHSNKQAGQLTHYGDQALLLLESIDRNKGFQADVFSREWQGFFQKYQGYQDHATRTTLENLSRGQVFFEAGSHSDELGGSCRIAPLIYYYHKNKKILLEAVKEQTFLTHNHPLVIESAVFIARVALKVLSGEAPVFAIEDMLAQEVANAELSVIVREGIRSVSMDSASALKKLGQSCALNHALSGAIHFIVKYEDNLQEALTMNVLCGGDSASRGMVIGMILGCSLGKKAIPDSWMRDLVSGPLL
ncbi:MAG: ADP-ribosylglycohydrolase family protein, partial [Spirochaetae bacterium HGW-Spirochaetae-6]